ncbi:SCO6880 family protein [Rhodococcus sp. BH5]|uniref:SCO6880 family protein n=1 Tax=Rhodococcus sp. BH5 TaxID=2871702 RepID=UPI0022CD4CAA|nr:SCO6880 family protein [Rhodococcus sp. BH5]MCZ9635043.1 hypothetical protein [Rhodococcus sp. BH5]
MSETREPKAPYTFGDYRRAQGFSIGGIPLRRMSLAGALGLCTILSFNFSMKLAAVMLVTTALVSMVFVIPWGARKSTMYEWVRYYARGKWRISRGVTDLVSGPLTQFERRNRLPGVLAPLVPVTVSDGAGGEQVVLHNRATGIISAIARCAPVGTALADRDDADSWVANYGSLLASLGYRQMVESLAITIDSAPSGGSTQEDYVRDRMNDHRDWSPTFAQAVMEDLVTTNPAVSADVTTTVTVNFDPAKMNPKPATMEQAVGEALRWMPSIENGLSSAGATVIGRAQLPWLVRRLRMAFDPAARREATRQLEVGADDAEVLAWSDGGAMRALEEWKYYQHDSGVSHSWVMDAPPTGSVQHSILIPLLAPGPYPRRVSLVYHPLGAADAKKVVEKEISAGTLRTLIAAKTKKDVTQRDIEDRRRALRAASAEAQGAGVGTFTMYVTTTVDDESELAAAIADVENRAGQCKLTLREAHGAEAAVFGCSLGLGIDPTRELTKKPGTRWEPK